MKKFYLIAVAGLVLGAVAGCQSTVKEVEKQVDKPVGVSIDASTLLVGKDGGNRVVSFTANEAWTLASDSDWIVPDKTSGEAGKATVILAIDPYQGEETRSGKVTLTAGSTSSVFTVEQTASSVFGTELDIYISAKAQDIEIPVQANVAYTVTADASWLTVAQTKAAVESGVIKIHAAANSELGPRTGQFTIAADGFSAVYSVTQSAEFIPAVEATGTYLGSAQDPYDNDAYIYNTFQQFAVTMVTAEGETVVLALNAADPEGYSIIPVGTYEVDATATHAPGTFSLKPTSSFVKYYTTIRSGEKEIVVYDGEITVDESEGQYAITAILVDDRDNQYSYSYQGPIEVSNESCSLENSDADYLADFNTYFTNQLGEWNLFFYASRPAGESDYPIRSFSVTVFDAKSEEVPTGAFTFKVPEADASLTYANGIMKTDAGTFYNLTPYCVYPSGEGLDITLTLKEGTTPSFEIQPDATGTYTVKVKATFVQHIVKHALDEEGYWAYDENGNDIIESEKDVEVSMDETYVNVSLAEPVRNSYYTVYPDGDYTLRGELFNAKYMPFWYGSPLSEGCHVFAFGFNSIDNNYSIYMALNVKQDYTFEVNFPANRPRFTSNAFKTGTYPFSYSGDPDTMIPMTNWHRVVNAYSGTTYQIVGGSITLTDALITYDLTCKAPDGNTIAITGSHAATFYYAQNYSTRTMTLDTAE